MKKIISIGLIFTLVFQTFVQLYYLGYYQLNKGFIAEILCINKEKPEMHCEGKCFLNEKLEKAGQTASEQEKQLVENNLRLQFILHVNLLFKAENPPMLVEEHPVFQQLNAKETFSRLFKPPRLV